MNFEQSSIYKIQNIVFKLNKIAQGLLKEGIGISYGEFLILMHASSPNTSNQQDLVQLLDVSKSVVSQRIRNMVDKGLLLQILNPENRREYIIELTDKGRRCLQASYQLLLDNGMQIFSPQIDETLQPILDLLLIRLDAFASSGESAVEK